MRDVKEPNKTFYRPKHKNTIQHKIINKADSKLNDVLINGIRLNFFKVANNKNISCSNKNNTFETILEMHQKEQEVICDQQNLFKNNAIRRRLKSLETDPYSTDIKNNDFNSTTTANKKFIPYKQITKIPLQLISLPTKTTQQSEQVVQNIKNGNLNKKYYNELKKDLVLYSTINRFNSSSYKNRIEHGKYIGFTSHKHKKLITDRQSNLIHQKFDRMDRDYREKQLSLANQRNIIDNLSQEKPYSTSQHYCSVTTEHAPQASPSILREYMNHQSQRQKLKICYSNKYHLKRWKEYLHQIKNKHEEVLHDQRLVTTLSSQR